MQAAGARTVDVANLVLLRICAGVGFALFAVSLLCALHPNEHFLDATFRVPYPFFTWVPVLGKSGLTALAAVLLGASLAMASGFRYRIAAWTVAVIYTYFFLIDSVYYDNVAYFALLVVVLLAASPAQAAFSVDAYLRKKRGLPPLAARHARLSLFLLRFQVACVYVFAAISKLYPDWFRGEPLRLMCPDYAPARWLSAWLSSPMVFVCGSYLAFAFELAIVPLLLYRRTALYAFAAALLFHLHNGLTMPLGAVPWVIAFATTVFVRPPSRLRLDVPISPVPARKEKVARALVLAWVAVQVVIPLRRWVTAGDPMFHGVGYDFTWAMRSRLTESGGVFRLVDEAGHSSTEVLAPRASPEVARIVSRDPFMIWWSAHELARTRHVRVYASVVLQLNARPKSPLVDPNVDLGAQSYPLVGVPAWVNLRDTPR